MANFEAAELPLLVRLLDDTLGDGFAGFVRHFNFLELQSMWSKDEWREHGTLAGAGATEGHDHIQALEVVHLFHELPQNFHQIIQIMLNVQQLFLINRCFLWLHFGWVVSQGAGALHRGQTDCFGLRLTGGLLCLPSCLRLLIKHSIIVIILLSATLPKLQLILDLVEILLEGI